MPVLARIFPVVIVIVVWNVALWGSDRHPAEKAADELCKAIHAGDSDQCYRLIHSQSPEKIQVIKSLLELHSEYEVKYTPKQISYVGESDDLAFVICIVEESLIRYEGKVATSNAALHGLALVLKKDNEDWKLWKRINLPVLVADQESL